jgi:hypothetical protein
MTLKKPADYLGMLMCKISIPQELCEVTTDERGYSDAPLLSNAWKALYRSSSKHITESSRHRLNPSTT